jgi:hypothetical protein
MNYMTLPNIFTEKISIEVIQRINLLEPVTAPGWGKMSVDQMLAHCNVSYEMVYENTHAKPNFLMKAMLKLFIKPNVTGTAPYKHNSPTSPAFLIKTRRDFDEEKKRLIGYIRKTQELGEDYFDNKASHSFGHLSKEQWNNLFYKHIDHHLRQFGV